MATMMRSPQLVMVEPINSPFIPKYASILTSFSGSKTPTKPTINPKFLAKDSKKLKRTQKILSKQRKRTTMIPRKTIQKGLTEQDINTLQNLNKFQLFGLIKPDTIVLLSERLGRTEFKRIYNLNNQEYTDAMNSIKGVGVNIDNNTLLKFGREERIREIGVKKTLKKENRFRSRNNVGRGRSQKISQWNTSGVQKINPKVFKPRKNILSRENNFSRRSVDQNLFNLRRKSENPNQNRSGSVLHRKTRLSLAPKMSKASTRTQSMNNYLRNNQMSVLSSSVRGHKKLAYGNKTKSNFFLRNFLFFI